MQSHLDSWSNEESSYSKTGVNDTAEGMNRELYKVFEKYMDYSVAIGRESVVGEPKEKPSYLEYIKEMVMS